jgi:GNAT superfamily N-acetyltransferase
MKKKTALTIRECFPSDADVKPLLSLLSSELLRLTGNDGTASFSDDGMIVERSIFLVAVANGEPVGCGGLRPITHEVCEIKRMYAKYRGQGIGGEILDRLESYAQAFGYKHIWLETRKINEEAVKFYLAHGYKERSNYGKYVGRDDAICFEKDVAAE